MAYKQIANRKGKIGQPRVLCSDPRCKTHGSAILNEVLDEIAKVLQYYIKDFEVQIDRGVDNSAELHKQMLERLEKKLAHLRELEIRQWDEKTKGGMPDHVFERLNAQTVADIKDVTQAICEAKESAPVHVDLHEKLVTFRTALALLNDPDAPTKEQNALLRACIERIVYSRPRVEGYAGKNGNPEDFHLDFTLRV